MGYLTAKQFSEKWGITERRIIKLCKEKRISGAVKNGKIWVIPEDTLKPSDKRNNVSKYINTQKRILILGFFAPIVENLIPLLKKEGYIIDVFYSNEIINKNKYKDIHFIKVDFGNLNDIKTKLKETNKYYHDFIFLDFKEIKKEAYKKIIINDISKKMNCESSIVIVDNNNVQDSNLAEKYADNLKREIGIRINCIRINAILSKNVIIRYDEIAEDIVDLIINFKNTTGQIFITDGSCLKFDKNDHTIGFETGVFYKAINSFFKRLDKNSYMWCASTMMDDEWTEEPLEMDFMVQNIEAANRGAKMDRIFIFSKSKIKEFKNNKTLQIYMRSSINTMFVDYDEIKKERPELIDIVGEGWDGIDDKYLLVDMPCNGSLRGYISKNKIEVEKAFKCFNELKKYSKSLREILK